MDMRYKNYKRQDATVNPGIAMLRVAHGIDSRRAGAWNERLAVSSRSPATVSAPRAIGPRRNRSEVPCAYNQRSVDMATKAPTKTTAKPAKRAKRAAKAA